MTASEKELLKIWRTEKHNADMHVHTHLSDGDEDQSPDTVCRQAVDMATIHLSITDHDHVMPYEQRRALAAKHGIDLVSGCEFSCIWKRPGTGEKVIVHLGGHWLDPEDEGIRQILEHNQGLNYEGYVKEMLHLCSKVKPHPALKDIDAAYEKIKKAHPHSKHLGKRAAANFLVSCGCAESRGEAYDMFAHGGEAHVYPTGILDYVSFWDAMEAITNRSVCTLNHLFYYNMEENGNRALLSDFKAAGGQALETFYTRYKAPQRDYLLEMCEEYELLPNCGSDRHEASRLFIDGPGLAFLRLRQRQLEEYGTLNDE